MRERLCRCVNRVTIELRQFKLRVGKVTVRRVWGMTAAAFLVAGLTGLSWGAQANGQTTQQAIAARLVGQPLYIRGMWVGDDLKFEADDGQPEMATATVPFTEAGIDVRSVELKDGRLMIEGQRMALEFVSTDTIQRVPAKAEHYNGKMRLEIATDASGDYGKALDAIFTSDLTSLIPSLPSYWQSYAKGHFCNLTLVEKKRKKVSKDATALKAAEQVPCLPGGSDAPASAADGRRKAGSKHVVGGVKPPRVLKSSAPSFTGLAQALEVHRRRGGLSHRGEGRQSLSCEHCEACRPGTRRGGSRGGRKISICAGNPGREPCCRGFVYRC